MLAFVNEYRLVVPPVTDENGEDKAEKYGRNTCFTKSLCVAGKVVLI